MYNGEVVEREYAFLQCLLWQDLDFAAEPTMHQVVVNNISAKPAGCIATLSLYKSLDLHKQQYPETARWQLKENSYFDDLGLKAGTLKRMAEVDNMDVGNIARNLSLEESGLEPRSRTRLNFREVYYLKTKTTLVSRIQSIGFLAHENLSEYWHMC